MICIEPSTTPAGMKNKVIERKIREIKDKRRCMNASLKYVLPDKLDGEVLIAKKIAVNIVPNKETGTGTTPYQIVSGRKVTLQPFQMGEIGLVNARREDTSDL